MGSKADRGGVVQDVLVPWVVKPGPGEGKKRGGVNGINGRGTAGANGGERANGTGKGGERQEVTETNGGEKEANDTMKEVDGNANGEPKLDDKVYNRYYHLFVEGELRDLVCRAAASEGFAPDRREGGGKYLRVVNEGWEADNWWIEGEVGLAAEAGA